MSVHVSVIIPCYNVDKEMFLKCIDSILLQSMQDFEIIIVDDGSRGEYAAFWEDIKCKDERIRVFRKENGGVSSARNLGLQYASGEYIVYVDADDFLVPNFFQEAYEIAKTGDFDIVYGCNIHINNFDDYVISPLDKEKHLVYLNGEELKSLRPHMVGKRLRFENGLLYIGRGPWTRLVKREIAVQVPFDCSLKICEDVVWNLQILDLAKKVCYAKRLWYVYNIQNGNSATKKFNPKVIAEAEAGLNTTIKLLALDNPAEYKALGDRCVEDISRICSKFFGSQQNLMTQKQKRTLYQHFYTSYPWTVLGTWRYFCLADKKDKAKVILFRCRVLIRFYRLKQSL